MLSGLISRWTKPFLVDVGSGLDKRPERNEGRQQSPRLRPKWSVSFPRWEYCITNRRSLMFESGYEAQKAKIDAAIRDIQAQLGQRRPGRPVRALIDHYSHVRMAVNAMFWVG